MPTASSIYWNSVDSQRSSGGSSGDGNSGNNRHYVDPWDLENYAYLRRHSVTVPAYQQIQSRAGNSRLSHHPHPEPEYWYSPSVREPGYDAPASVEEIYFGVPKQTAQNYNYPQSIYEDDVSHYAAPQSIYSPVSQTHQSEPFEVHKPNVKLRRRSKLQQSRGHRREECVYHGVVEEDYHYHMNPLPSRTSRQQDSRYVAPSRLDLNTYGHLKIDYTNSWDSLHRKISK